MKKRCKAFATFILASLAGINIIAGAFSAMAEDNVKSSNIPSEGLWDVTSGFTIEKNVDVPDYMKYGSFVHYSNINKIYTVDENSEDDYLEDWETNGVRITSKIPEKEIYFSNIVNIDSFTTKDNLLVISPLNERRGIKDFSKMVITLEDADDPENFLKISIKENTWWPSNIMLAVSTPNIDPTGYRWGDYGDLFHYGCTDRVGVSYEGYTTEPNNKKEVEEWRHRPIKIHYDVKSIHSKGEHTNGRFEEQAYYHRCTDRCMA